MRIPVHSLLLASAILALLAIAATPAHSELNGEWSSLDPTIPIPNERRELPGIYDVVNRRFVIFAGRDSNPEYQLLNEVWTLSLGANPTWTRLDIQGSIPGKRHNPQIGYDPARNRLLVFGGYGLHYPSSPAYEYLNDVWQLSLDHPPVWTELFPSGTAPSGRLAGASVYDVLRQRFVGFGGTIGLPVDTWQLDLSGPPQWKTIPTTGVSPRGSYGMASIYDPVGDRMLIFGGSTSDDYFGTHNDTWELSLIFDTPAWRQLSPAGPLPLARRQMQAIFDPRRYRMIVYGGWDGTSNNPSTILGDTWALSLHEDPAFSQFPYWTQLTPQGGPPPKRDAYASAYDPLGDRMIVYGGWTGTDFLGDTWFLSWSEIGQSASMTASGEAVPTAATVEWNVQDATGTHAGIYRREAGTPWASIATAESDANGAWTYTDDSVVPGHRYGYQIAVSSQLGAELGGEVWIDVPTPLDVDPVSKSAFRLDRVLPNPAVDRLVASFGLADAQPAHLELLDLTGRRVYSREVGSMGPGPYQLEIDGVRAFEPGMYFVRLVQAGRSQSTRVVIIGGGTNEPPP